MQTSCSGPPRARCNVHFSPRAFRVGCGRLAFRTAPRHPPIEGTAGQGPDAHSEELASLTSRASPGAAWSDRRRPRRGGAHRTSSERHAKPRPLGGSPGRLDGRNPVGQAPEDLDRRCRLCDRQAGRFRIAGCAEMRDRATRFAPRPRFPGSFRPSRSTGADTWMERSPRQRAPTSPSATGSTKWLSSRPSPVPAAALSPDYLLRQRMRNLLLAEVKKLEAAGIRVRMFTPTAADIEVMGPNSIDIKRSRATFDFVLKSAPGVVARSVRQWTDRRFSRTFRRAGWKDHIHD